MRLPTAVLLFALFAAPLGAAEPCFPGAVGWGSDTLGGRGGKVITVTNLAGSGPGSLREALATPGSRIVVFAVGGVIDLAEEGLEVHEPFLTLAGQTAPEPGITLIRGGLRITAHDVVVRHISLRPGDAGKPKKSGWEPDGITTYTKPGAAEGPHNVVIDHCSLTWAVDENLTASGPRHDGPQMTSHRMTFSNNIIGHSLSDSTHAKGEHSKGTLIHDNCREIAIIGNLYACNVERNPVLKPNATALIANNLIYNPRKRAVHTYWNKSEYTGRPMLPSTLAVVGNVLWLGPDSPTDLPLIFIANGQASVFAQDNLTSNLAGQPTKEVDGKPAMLKERPFWPGDFKLLPSAEVVESVLKNCGARPWARNPIDTALIAGVRARTARIIDSQEEVGGYPKHAASKHDLAIPTDPAKIEAWLESFIKQP